MRGVLLTRHGDEQALCYRDDLPTPTPTESEVVVRVAASSVNNTDINTRVGWYAREGQSGASWAGNPIGFPRIQGADVCGTIEAVGAQTPSARLGERVLIEPCLRRFEGNSLTWPWYLGSECDGGFAEYVKVDASHAHAITSTLSDAELASFPCAYATAENLLTRAGVVAGERLLVTGASGGVGSAVVQLACARGAHVVAVASAAKIESVRALGAHEVLARGRSYVDALGTDSIDVVIDLVGGPLWSQLVEILRYGGRYAVSGAIGGAQVELDLRVLYLKDLSFFGCTALGSSVFRSLIDNIERGLVRPLIAETYRLEQIREAQRAFQEKASLGKIVLTVSS